MRNCSKLKKPMQNYSIETYAETFPRDGKKLSRMTIQRMIDNNQLPTRHVPKKIGKVWVIQVFDYSPSEICDDVSFAQFEMAWTSLNGTCKKFDKHPTQDNRIHPTQKPIDLYDWILKNYAKQGDKILDTHFGSGSIALAVNKANQLDKMNLHLTACEIDEEYINKAIERIKFSIKQTALNL